jgi:putative endonuclease
MPEEKLFYVYILASDKNGTLYIGITSKLRDRIHQHKTGEFDGFTKKYNVKNLVYYEIFGDSYAAISREKQLKEWKRKWKIELIEKDNPDWRDLYDDLWK